MAETLREGERRLREADSAAARIARNAVRGLRARLVLAGDQFDPDWVWLLRRELRFLEQAIGDLVDAHALVSWVGRQDLDRRDEPTRAELLGELARERSRAHRRLVALLDSARYERMVRDLGRPYLRPGHVTKLVGKEWRALRSLVGAQDGIPGDQDRHRLATRIDRLRHGADLHRAGRGWAKELGELRDRLDGLQEASLAQGWLRHTTEVSALHWDLVAGQLLERARGLEAERWQGFCERWVRCADKSQRAWLRC